MSLTHSGEIDRSENLDLTLLLTSNAPTQSTNRFRKVPRRRTLPLSCAIATVTGLPKESGENDRDFSLQQLQFNLPGETCSTIALL